MKVGHVKQFLTFPNILDKMEQEDQSIWWQIEPYQVLEKFGHKAAPAADLLERFLRENKLPPSHVIQTMKILGTIGPAAKKVPPTIEAYTKITSYTQRYMVPDKPEEVAEIKKEAEETLKVLQGK